MIRRAAVLALLSAAGLVSACASAPTSSGFLTRYDGMTPREGTLRSRLAETARSEALTGVRVIALEPATLLQGPATDWMSAAERELVLRETDAQLCFELTERYRLAGEGETPDALVRAAVTMVRPTGRVASALSAAADFFIPGPIGLRAPGTTGALAAEAEMLDGQGAQIAAISWTRAATPVGTDTPSLSRVGDALQFVEPFADEAARVMTAPGATPAGAPDPDPCARFGPRVRPAGFLTRAITGLYVPEAGAARKPGGD